MKAGLKRIEATLHDLGIRNPDSPSAKSPAKKNDLSHLGLAWVATLPSQTTPVKKLLI